MVAIPRLRCTSYPRVHICDCDVYGHPTTCDRPMGTLKLSPPNRLHRSDMNLATSIRPPLPSDTATTYYPRLRVLIKLRRPHPAPSALGSPFDHLMIRSISGHFNGGAPRHTLAKEDAASRDMQGFRGARLTSGGSTK